MKLIIPSSAVNKNDLWQHFLDLHNLRGQVYSDGKLTDAAKDIFAAYDQWKEILTQQGLTFEPFKFMGISPNNSGYNHY